MYQTTSPSSDSDTSNNRENRKDKLNELSIEMEPSACEREEEEMDSLYECIDDSNSVMSRSDCLELNLNPLVWQKFQYLLSVLKDIQNNVQEMDSLMLDRKDEKDLDTSQLADKLLEENSSMNQLVHATESSKTDEVKLNEIIGLLHRITQTLSSFEQNPLMTDEFKKDFRTKLNLNSTTILYNEQTQEATGEESSLNKSKNASKSYAEHHFIKQTTNLREEIEDVIRRKKILDERLNSLLMQRQIRQETEDKTRDDSSVVECPLISQTKVTTHDNVKPKLCSYLSENGSSNTSLVDEAVIMDLKHDENEIPGLAESGLSSEITSLSITINNIIEENKQLHSIYNDFTEAENHHSDKRKVNGVSGTKPKKKIQKKFATKTTFDGYNHQRSTEEGEHNLDSMSFSLPFLKKTFDKKLRELMKEQTDMASQLNEEKKLFMGKTRSLEKIIADLMRINRENRVKYIEEIHAIDVENCRLEDEVFSLKRQNQKLSKENLRSRTFDNPSAESQTRDEKKGLSLCNCCSFCTNHDTCFEYFQLLLKDRELNEATMSKKLKKCSNLRQKFMTDFPSSPLSTSETNLNEEMFEDHKFSSLPIIVEPIETKPAKDNKNNFKISNSNSDLSLLKERVGYLESHINQRITGERFNRSADTSPMGELGTSSLLPSPNSARTDPLESEALKYKHKICSLSKENEELVKRIEELMGMIRELSSLVRSTKEELLLTRRERNLFLEKLKKKVETSDLDQALMNSEGCIKLIELNTKLQEKCCHLQMELEKAWNEAEKNASDRDKMAAEKETLNDFVTSSLADIEEENLSLKTALKKLEEKTNEQCPLKNDVILVDEQTETEGLQEVSQNNNKETLGSNLERDKVDGNETSQSSLKSKEEEINAIWQKSILWLQRCFTEEKLHNQVLEAAERENSARVAVLQQRVKERGEKYQELLTKYKKLHLMLLASKVEKKANKRLFKECSSKVEEFNTTTTKIEDNYKVMLSSLGNNIGIAVEILSSHLYFSPSQIHPSPELSADPAFWFAAQCSRLRWLQAQLRKLCLHSWKNNSFFTSDVKSFGRSRKDKKISNSLISGRSFDFDDRSIGRDKVLRTSYSTPASPSKVVAVVKEESQESNPSSPNFEQTGVSSILSSLNDAELSLTSQQVKLTRSKNLQFNNLVGILKRNGDDGNPLSLTSSFTSDVISVKNSEASVVDSFDSVDNTLSEGLDKLTPKQA